MPKLEDAARTLVRYIEEAYTRGGTGPQVSREMRGELHAAISEFGRLDDRLAAPYPPVGDAELVDCFVFDNVFDRVVVTRNGIYGRKGIIWSRLRPLAEQERIEAARVAKEEAEAKAKEAEAVADGGPPR